MAPPLSSFRQLWPLRRTDEGPKPASRDATGNHSPQEGAGFVWLRLAKTAARNKTQRDELTLVGHALLAACPGLDVRTTVEENAPAPPLDGLSPAGAEDPGPLAVDIFQWITLARPRAILAWGTEDRPPTPLISAAEAAKCPLFLGGSRFDTPPRRFDFGAERRVLSKISGVFVPDETARAKARQAGVAMSRLHLTGPLSETITPPRSSEAERATMASTLQGRQTWLAIDVPASEDGAVLAAHAEALRYSHRALLILVPDDPRRAKDLHSRLEAEGWAVAFRDDDQEPEHDIQILLSSDLYEAGLWLRLAPVCYFGGTLGQGSPRHPFEAATLGSAILHGPRTTPFAQVWDQLDRAGAAMPVKNAQDLCRGVVDFLSPEQAANYASAAWHVSTGGTAVAHDIARVILAAIKEESPC